MSKRVVMSIHGIRTRGVWQKDLVPMLARADFIPYALDYGKFSAISLVLKWRREAAIAALLGAYNRVVDESRDERPSIVAHSFGTYQVAALVERYPDVKFDKVILAASIVRTDFPWPTFLARGQVNYVENDFGGRDLWPKVAAKVVGGAGASGTAGFSLADDLLNQRRFSEYKHSNYFHNRHFKNNWIPTLLLNSRRVVGILRAAIREAAKMLNLPADKVRANVFIPDKSAQNRLRIAPGLHLNMDFEPELGITIPTDLNPESTIPGAGTAYKERKAVAVKYDSGWWNQASAVRPHPELQWIVSIPMIEDEAKPLVGVLNVDGLVAVDIDRLKSLADTLVSYAQAIRPSIADAGEWL